MKVTEHISFVTTFLTWSLLTDTGNLCSEGQACVFRSGAIDIIATGAHFLSNACDSPWSVAVLDRDGKPRDRDVQ
jgi:hypothetical protein